MEYTLIPGTQLRISKICLGTMTFGTPVAGPAPVRLVVDAYDRAGYTYNDTANMS